MGGVPERWAGVGAQRAGAAVKSHSAKQCVSCRRLGGEERARRSDAVTVVLCPECNESWFARERAFVEAAGGKFDPAVAGRPKVEAR